MKLSKAKAASAGNYSDLMKQELRSRYVDEMISNMNEATGVQAKELWAIIDIWVEMT